MTILDVLPFIVTALIVILMLTKGGSKEDVQSKFVKPVALIPPMNDVRVLDVNLYGVELKAVLDVHHGSHPCLWTWHDGEFYHTIKRDNPDWKKVKKISMTAKRVLMFAVLLKENGIAYQINNL